MLAEVLRPDSGIAPRSLRTDAHRADLAFDRWPAPEALRVVHLDAHGKSGVEVADDDLDAVFSFQVRDGNDAVSVSDTELLDLLRALGCAVFFTNSCSAAQQRGIDEVPFPAQVVRAGARVALGAREPLQAGAAVALFRSLYARLAAGVPLADAVRSGLDALRDSSGTTDECTYRLVQPVLWLRDIDDLAMSFAGTPGEPVEPARLTTEEGVLGRLFAAAEDMSGPITVQAQPSSGLSADTLDHLGHLLTRCAPTSGPGGAFLLPRLTFRERMALVASRFAGPPALHELLANVLPEDPTYLDRMSVAHDRDPIRALLTALSWGGAPAVEFADRVADARAQVNRHAEETAADEAPLRQLRRAYRDLQLALPAYAQRDDTVEDGLPLPALSLTEDVADHIRAGRLASVVDPVCLIEPFPVVQDVVRAGIPPQDVHVLSLRRVIAEPTRTRTEDLAWSSSLRASTTANLALAVAARQLGQLRPARSYPGRTGPGTAGLHRLNRPRARSKDGPARLAADPRGADRELHHVGGRAGRRGPAVGGG
ncbi:MAG: CHAT domain-containing protein [Actinophytocola sp.]|uniref:CHAT domain-containing protein n=1 Tax=Actinophytocola sp. TaxID=1872138 RepID=UPI003C74396A